MSKKKTYIQRIRAICGNKISLKQIPKSEYCSPGQFSLYKNEKYIANFYLQQLPGCCGVCISHSNYISPHYRNKGLGRLLNRMRQQIAWDSGYTIMLCTDRKANVPQQKILKKTGWEEVSAFKNRRTQNDVGVHVKKLRNTGYKVGATTPEGQPFSIVLY